MRSMERLSLRWPKSIRERAEEVVPGWDHVNRSAFIREAIEEKLDRIERGEDPNYTPDADANETEATAD